jgi:sugar phosphate isomerase/epimerase
MKRRNNHMKVHWDNFCTMSIVHFMAFPSVISGEGSMVESVTKIAGDSFFGGIEIGWIKDDKERARVKNILNVAHMKVKYAAQSALLLQKLNVNSLDEAQRMRAVDQLKRCVDEAEEIGAKGLAFLSGIDPGDADRSNGLDALAKSIKQVNDYAEDKGIQLVLEVFDYDIDKKCLIGPNDVAAEFCRRMRKDIPSFGLLCDLSHVPLQHDTTKKTLNELKGTLAHIHVGNCVLDPKLPGYGDLHPRFGFPGGSNDVPELAEFIRTLFDIGYLAEGRKEKPWVGFEVKPLTADETSEMVIAGTKRAWQEAWALA